MDGEELQPLSLFKSVRVFVWGPENSSIVWTKDENELLSVFLKTHTVFFLNCGICGLEDLVVNSVLHEI